jgi:hypothetical protein
VPAENMADVYKAPAAVLAVAPTPEVNGHCGANNARDRGCGRGGGLSRTSIFQADLGGGIRIAPKPLAPLSEVLTHLAP